MKNSLEIASMVQRVLKITSNWVIPSISSTRAALKPEICDEKSWENLCESPPRLRKRFSQLLFSANACELSSHPRRSEWANLWMLLTILVQKTATESSTRSLPTPANSFPRNTENCFQIKGKEKKMSNFLRASNAEPRLLFQKRNGKKWNN